MDFTLTLKWIKQIVVVTIELNKSVTKAYLYCSLTSVLWRICSHFLLIIWLYEFSDSMWLHSVQLSLKGFLNCSVFPCCGLESYAHYNFTKGNIWKNTHASIFWTWMHVKKIITSSWRDVGAYPSLHIAKAGYTLDKSPAHHRVSA